MKSGFEFFVEGIIQEVFFDSDVFPVSDQSNDLLAVFCCFVSK